jgi:hypothetical protein
MLRITSNDTDLFAMLARAVSNGWLALEETHIKEVYMADFITGGGKGDNLLGRRILVVLPSVVVLMCVFIAFMAAPLRYYFKVSGGNLYLMAGKLAYLDESRSKAFEPVPVEGMDLKDITSQSFESESAALSSIREESAKMAEAQCLQLMEKEKELVAPYKSLLTSLRIAHSAGAAKYARDVDVLKGWLEMYAEKTAKMKSAEKPQAVAGQ